MLRHTNALNVHIFVELRNQLMLCVSDLAQLSWLYARQRQRHGEAARTPVARAVNDYPAMTLGDLPHQSEPQTGATSPVDHAAVLERQEQARPLALGDARAMIADAQHRVSASRPR